MCCQSDLVNHSCIFCVKYKYCLSLQMFTIINLNSTALNWKFKRRTIWFFAWRLEEWWYKIFDFTKKICSEGSEWMWHKPSQHSLSDPLYFHFSGTTQANTHKYHAGTQMLTVPVSLSSLGRLHCFTADCEDCTKWSWWSLYFPSQLTNQFHILSSLRPPLSLPASFFLCLSS